MIYRQPNGVVLDTRGGWTASATEYAKNKGLKDHVVVLATEPDGTRTYVLYNAGVPIYSSASFEAICAHIDVVWTNTNFRG